MRCFKFPYYSRPFRLTESSSMSFYNTLNRSLIAPASDLLLGRSIFEKLKFLEESQWWDEAMIRTYQDKRLRELISYAYQQVPFYKRHMDQHGVQPGDIEGREDLYKLPIIQKSDIREIARQRAGRNVKKISGVSSGSTGEPLQYTKSVDAYSMHTATAIRGWQWMGFGVGDKYIKISQNPRKGWMKHLQDKVNRSAYHFLKDINDSEFEKLQIKINTFKPKFIRCYPDPLLFFSRYIKRSGKELPPIKAINTTGNILYPEARQFIQENLKTEVFDAYSCEGGAVFYQTTPDSPYFGADEYAITEVLDSAEQPVKHGDKGRLVTTDLWNKEVPFIRYDTQDIVTLSLETTNSNRKLTKLDHVDGRDCDILITPDGRLVIVHIFTIFFEWYASVDQFQAIQETETRFRILLSVNDAFTKEHYQEIETYWNDYFGPDAELDIEIVDEIPARPSGKRKFLERNENIPLPV